MVRKFKYSREEHARMGNEIYENRIRPLVEEGNKGKIVAIDLDSGDYELNHDELAAYQRLTERRPDAQIWFVRIGQTWVHRIPIR